MHPRVMEIKMIRWATNIVTLFSVIVILVPVTQADDGEISGRVVMHSQRLETMEVGDVPGHILGINQQTGLVILSKGEIGTIMSTTHFDYVNGKGTLVLYRVNTFQDGSTLLVKQVGTSTPVDDGKRTVWEGTIECIGGTGKFEGFKGTGNYKGERIGALKTGADGYADFTLKCKKP